MVISTVVFDADETLVDLRPAVRGALDAVVDDVRAAYPGIALSRADLEADWATAMAAGPGLSATRIRRTALAASLDRVGLLSDLDRLLDLFFTRRFALSRPFDEALPILEALRPRYRLGYATNGNSAADRCGLGGRFHFEVYAHRNGLPKKPDPGFYAAVVAAAGAPPGEIAHVGDNLAHDVVGARAAGLRTVWLNPAGRPLPAGTPPVTQIRRLAELAGVLDVMSAPRACSAPGGHRCG